MAKKKKGEKIINFQQESLSIKEEELFGDDFMDDDDFDENDYNENMTPEMQENIQNNMVYIARLAGDFGFLISEYFDIEVLYEQAEEKKSIPGELSKYLAMISDTLYYMFDRNDIFRKNVRKIKGDQKEVVLDMIHTYSATSFEHYYAYSDFMDDMEENWKDIMVDFLKDYKKVAIEYLGNEAFKESLVLNFDFNDLFNE